MGLIASVGSRRLHVLLVEVPGCVELRMRAEAVIVAAGHVVAGHPADSDMLLVCGSPGPELGSLIERVWDQMPHPKRRLSMTGPADIDSALAVVLNEGDASASAAETLHRSDGPHSMGEHGHEATSAHDHMSMGGHGGGGMPMAGHDHGMSMSGHDHMSMSGPGGYPLASGADDRDGLEMDVLHRRLGPILPAWPGGLVVDVTLSGDTIVDATAFVIDGGGTIRAEQPDAAVVLLDRAARILAVAGWDAAAARALHARDLALTGDAARTRRLLRPLHRRIRRSAVLRWSLRGLPVRPETDVRDVLLERLEGAEHALQGRRPDPEATVDAPAIPELITGRDLGTARLIIAGLVLDTARARDAAMEAGAPHHHG